MIFIHWYRKCALVNRKRQNSGKCKFLFLRPSWTKFPILSLSDSLEYSLLFFPRKGSFCLRTEKYTLVPSKAHYWKIGIAIFIFKILQLEMKQYYLISILMVKRIVLFQYLGIGNIFYFFSQE